MILYPAVPAFFDTSDNKDEAPVEEVSCPVDAEGAKKQVCFGDEMETVYLFVVGMNGKWDE